MTLPKVSKNHNINNNCTSNIKLAPSQPSSDVSTLKCGVGCSAGKQKKKKSRGPSKRSIGLETSSVVPPPEIPHRDDMSLLSLNNPKKKNEVMKKNPTSTTLVETTEDVSKSKNLGGPTSRPSPGVQRHLSTTSTVPPPPPSGGLRRHNGTENVHPGAVRMAGLRSTSNNTIEIGDPHPMPRNGQVSTNRPPRPRSRLVRAFLVEDDPPTAAVTPIASTVQSEPSRSLSHFSGISQDSTTIMTTKEDPVSAVPMSPPNRSFCDLLKDWRVLVLIFVFSLLVAALVIGLGVYSGLNFSLSNNHKPLEAQTLGPSASNTPSTMPMSTPMPVHSVVGHPTRAPTRSTITQAPVLRPTRAPTTYRNPTRSPTQEPNSYEGDYEDGENGGDSENDGE